MKQQGGKTRADAASNCRHVSSTFSCSSLSLSRHSHFHSVCIRDQKEAFLVKPRFPQDFVYLTLDISDHEVHPWARDATPLSLLCRLGV